MIPRAISRSVVVVDRDHRAAVHVDRQPERAHPAARRIGDLTKLADAGEVADDRDQRRAQLARALRMGQQRHHVRAHRVADAIRRAGRPLLGGAAIQEVAQLARLDGTVDSGSRPRSTVFKRATRSSPLGSSPRP